MAKLLTTSDGKPRQPPRKTGNQILDLWFTAQYEIDCGKMPTLVKTHDVALRNMGRVRAPTTWETLQNTINQNTSVQKEKNIEAGDYSDDEDEEDEIEYAVSPMSPDAPRDVGPKRVEMNRGDVIRRKWFKAQTQIQDGKNPSILKKHGNGYKIEDLRKYNKRFQTAVKGNDQYLDTNAKISSPRSGIAADFDEDGEDDDPLSVSSRNGSTAVSEMEEKGLDPITFHSDGRGTRTSDLRIERSDVQLDLDVISIDDGNNNNNNNNSRNSTSNYINNSNGTDSTAITPRTKGSDISPSPTPTKTKPTSPTGKNGFSTIVITPATTTATTTTTTTTTATTPSANALQSDSTKASKTPASITTTTATTTTSTTPTKMVTTDTASSSTNTGTSATTSTKPSSPTASKSSDNSNNKGGVDYSSTTPITSLIGKFSSKSQPTTLSKTSTKNLPGYKG